jgi:hypothetical protein
VVLYRVFLTYLYIRDNPHISYKQARQIGHVAHHNPVLTIMSSSEGDSGTEHHVEKARNVQRACDVCRRKKGESCNLHSQESINNVAMLSH